MLILLYLCIKKYQLVKYYFFKNFFTSCQIVYLSLILIVLIFCLMYILYYIYIYIRDKTTKEKKNIYFLFITFIFFTKCWISASVGIFGFSRYGLVTISLILFLQCITMYIFYPLLNKKFNLIFVLFIPISNWITYYLNINIFEHVYGIYTISPKTYGPKDIILIDTDKGKINWFSSKTDLKTEWAGFNTTFSRGNLENRLFNGLDGNGIVDNGKYIIANRLSALSTQQLEILRDVFPKPVDDFDADLRSKKTFSCLLYSLQYSSIQKYNVELFNNLNKEILPYDQLKHYVTSGRYSLKINPDLNLDLATKVRLMILTGRIRDELLLTTTRPSMHDVIVYYQKDIKDAYKTLQYTTLCSAFLQNENLAGGSSFNWKRIPSSKILEELAKLNNDWNNNH